MAILDNPGAWPPDFSTCVFLARVLTDLPPDIVWAALKSGELAVRTYSKGATKFTPVSSEAFRDADQAQVLETCRLEGSQGHWLYVTRRSLIILSMRNERQAPPNPVTPPVERWHPDDSLVEAALVREAKKRPNLLRAIEFIRRETNASIGAAQELLVAVCAAGKVRAWRVNGFQKERIPPQTWRDAMIDKNKLITAVSSGRPRTLQGRIVVISLEDLRHHLGASSGGSPPPTSPLALTVPPPLHVPVTKEPALEVAPVYPMEAPAPTTPPAPEPVVVNNGNQPKKQVELKKYANYQNTHKTETGRWSSRKEDTNWAKKNNCSVEHVRELRRSYKTNLTPEERGQFERHGKRATPK